jgi:hypothetical protein
MIGMLEAAEFQGRSNGSVRASRAGFFMAITFLPARPLRRGIYRPKAGHDETERAGGLAARSKHLAGTRIEERVSKVRLWE